MISLHNFYGLQCSCTCQWISTEGSSDGSRCRCFHDFFSCNNGRQRNTCCNGFCGCNNIRLYPCLFPVFCSKHTTCSAKSGLYFICNKKNSFLVTNLSYCLYPFNRCRDKSTFSLEWFHYHSCNGICRCTLFKHVPNGFHIIFHCLFLWHAFWISVVIRELGTIDTIRERPHANGICFL